MEIQLTKLQQSEVDRIIQKRDEIINSLNRTIVFIVDANGKEVAENSEWKIENGKLIVETK
jgi:hypothetical protein